ncbi:tyrosine-type recombinase/integrase [Funiculus sociatus GB2-M2]
MRDACLHLGIEGASTHSFRLTVLTQMSDTGIPLRVIQEVSGHHNLEELPKYLEVRPEQVRGAVSALSMLSYAGKRHYEDVEKDWTPVRSPVEKCMYDDFEENPPSTPIEGSSFIDRDS